MDSIQLGHGLKRQDGGRRVFIGEMGNRVGARTARSAYIERGGKLVLEQKGQLAVAVEDDRPGVGVIEAREVAGFGHEIAVRGVGRHSGEFEQRRPRKGPIDRESTIALEVAQGVLQHRTEDAVDPSGIESQLGEAHLQFSDVVTALIGAGEEDQPLAQLPASFNQSRPRDGVDLAGDRQAACALECLDGDSGAIAEGVARVRDESQAQDDQALVEFAHAKAGGATLQGGKVQGLV